MEPAAGFRIMFVASVFLHSTNSAPDPFCLDRFDDDDCGVSPKPVFYYYKAGSRCEVRAWRGCPTLNMFPDYFSCLHFCVGRIWGDREPPELSDSAEAAELERQAEKAAMLTKIVEARHEWKEEVKKLDDTEIKLIDKILGSVVKDVQHIHHKLSMQPRPGEDEDAETTTEFVYPTLDSSGEFNFDEIEVVVP